jgi:hypothetical protein
MCTHPGWKPWMWSTYFDTHNHPQPTLLDNPVTGLYTTLGKIVEISEKFRDSYKTIILFDP